MNDLISLQPQILHKLPSHSQTQNFHTTQITHHTPPTNQTMSPFIITIFTISILSLLLTPPPISAAAHDGETLSAYEVLKSYDFPIGLLPQGATGYDLDKSTGKFSAYLNGSCSFSLEGSYQLKYKPTIGGQIAKGKITNLSGISVKVLFMWLNIVEVVNKGNELEFSVGIASADFPMDNFEICPQCGCGLNCNGNGKVRKIRMGPSVSSI